MRVLRAFSVLQCVLFFLMLARGVKMEKMITGDEGEVGMEDLPAAVSIRIQPVSRRNDDPLLPERHVCTGTLYHSRLILTSGRCLKQIEYRSIRAVIGAISTSGDLQFEKAESIQIKSAIHSRDDRHLDFAILELMRPSKATPIKLLPARFDAQQIEANLIGKAFGYGAASSAKKKKNKNDAIETNYLKEIELKVDESGKCPTDQSIRNFKGYESLTSSFEHAYLCATPAPFAPKQSLCDGDAGAPLYATMSDGETYIVGIAAYGTQSCDPRKPNYFLKISHIRNEMMLMYQNYRIKYEETRT